MWWRRRVRPSASTPALRGLHFVAIDTETTGLDPHHDVLVALAAIPFRDGEPHVEDGYTRLVNPGRPIPHAATAIHGIADGDVRGRAGAPDHADGFAEAGVLPQDAACCGVAERAGGAGDVNRVEFEAQARVNVDQHSNREADVGRALLDNGAEGAARDHIIHESLFPGLLIAGESRHRRGDPVL